MNSHSNLFPWVTELRPIYSYRVLISIPVLSNKLSDRRMEKIDFIDGKNVMRHDEDQTLRGKT